VKSIFEPIYAGWGPDAYQMGQDGDLVLRASPPATLDRERAWVEAVRAEGFPAPEPVAGADGGCGMLVFRRPPGTSLAERMIADMAALPRLLADFGRLHAALHALPVPAGPPGPEPAAPEADAGAAPVVARQRAWLDRERPPAGHRVVCHGDLTPVHVVRNGDDSPGVPVNWTAATVAEPEYDVAATTVGFWSSALYGNPVQRGALRMVREPLASAYIAAYREVAPWPLDDGRLRYWQAFHLHRLASAIDRRMRSGPAGPWDAAAHVAAPARSLRDVDRRFREVSAG
jgi:aminoglycoside phosphotransferase (APT) family kinase protein